MNKKIFEGLSVLDLSTVLAGPSVATFFAELGANVTKVENPRTNGDVTRTWKLSSEDKQKNISAYFASVNYGKKYVWLDISLAADRSTLMSLIASADVLITNFKQGDDLKLQLTDTDILAINREIIHAKIKGFESNTERVAYDVVLQAETGFMHINGTQESGPVKMPVAMIDVLAAHHLKEGILCALYQKEKTGNGCVVECSLEKAGLASLINQSANYLNNGFVAERMGSLHPNIAPYGETFQCSDEQAIVLAIGSTKQFETMCELLGDPELSADLRFITNQLRVENRKSLSIILQSLFRKKTSHQWMSVFSENHIPAGAIKSMEEVMKNPVAQQMVLEEVIEGVLTKRMASVAFEITGAER